MGGFFVRGKKMGQRLIVLAAVVYAMLFGSSASSHAASTTPAAPLPVRGYVSHITSQHDTRTYLNLLSQSGATAVRDEIPWVDIEGPQGVFDWTEGDTLITDAAQNGLHLLMIVDQTPAFASGASTSANNWTWAPPTNPADYGTFAGRVAARYGANGTFWASHPTLPRVLPAGIELWNEENEAGFWGNSTPDPVKYAAMVTSAYSAIKAADPTMLVVTGGLAPAGAYNDVDCTGASNMPSDGSQINPVNYLQDLYANGIQGSVDAVGWHPYNFNAGWTASQMLAYDPCNAWSQMADTPVSARSLMTANGDGAKTIWATELGAPTCIKGATYTCVSESAQADLATQGVAAWRGYTWSGGFFWYDIRDDSGGKSKTDEEQHFGAVRANNSLKPSYNALKGAWTS